MLGNLRQPFVLLLLTCALGSVPVNARPHRRQCNAMQNSAMTVGHHFQTAYFPSGQPQSTGGSLWTDANALEDLSNLMIAAGKDDFASLLDQSLIGSTAKAGGDIPLGGSNDDSLWVVLALWKIADYKVSKGQDGSAYNNAASKIYDAVAGQWDATCGGGVWWSTAHNYKNSITNQLFLLTSAQAYQKSKDQKYLDNANKTWAWLKSSGLRNANNLWNDGLELTTCQNNGKTTWTYNQGVIASGLGALSAANGDKSLLDEADKTLDATIQQLTVNKVLSESCDGAAACNANEHIFKGIWTKHVMYYLDSANDAARTQKYGSFLSSQGTAVQSVTDQNGDVNSAWTQNGASYSPQSSASGLEALIASAKYGSC